MNGLKLRRQAQRDAFGPSEKRRRAALAAAVQNDSDEFIGIMPFRHRVRTHVGCYNFEPQARWSLFLLLPLFFRPLRLSLPLSLGAFASSSSAACAAANRATGTRKGEQLTYVRPIR